MRPGRPAYPVAGRRGRPRRARAASRTPPAPPSCQQLSGLRPDELLTTGEAADEAVHLGTQQAGARPGAWRRARRSGERLVAGDGSPELVELGPGRGRERGLDDARRVVAGGAGGRPGRRESLVALEDLLHDDPTAVGALPQPSEVALGVGEAVGVVDPEAVDDPGVVQVEQHGVGGVEDVVELDADRDQGVDVEEAPVVEHAVLVAPGGEHVVLARPGWSPRRSPGSRSDRERVTVVADDRGAAVLAEGELAGCQDLVERCRRARAGRASRRRAPSRRRTSARTPSPAHAEHVPERRVQVLGLGDAMWLGTTSTTMPRPCSWAAAASASSPSPAAEVVGDAGVVDDVVAVHRSGRGLQHGGEVEVRDAELGQVRDDRAGVREREPGCSWSRYVEVRLVGMRARPPPRARQPSHEHDERAAPTRSEPASSGSGSATCCSPLGVEDELPLLAERSVRQRHRDILVPRVEHEQERVVDDLLTAQSGLGDAVAVEEHGERRAPMPGPSRRSPSACPSGPSQAMSGSPSSAASPVKKRRRRKTWCSARSSSSRRVKAKQVLVDVRPVDPATSRCPGSRRCCCPAGCGRARRRAGSSARPG